MSLDDRQRPDHKDRGMITGADGHGYARRGTKSKRSVADDLVAAGVPLVFELYDASWLEWFDGDAATEEWAKIRPYVIATEPTIKQRTKHKVWTAGIWEADAGKQLLYLTGHC